MSATFKSSGMAVAMRVAMVRPLLNSLEARFNPEGLENMPGEFGPNFLASEIEIILWLYLTIAELVQSIPRLEKTRNYYSQKVKLLDALDKHVIDSDSDRATISELCASARSSIKLLQSARPREISRGRLLSKKCRFNSELATDVMTYLVKCKQIDEITLPKASERYAVVGNIVSAVSEPSCLACGGVHPFKHWRNIWGVDKQRDELPRNRRSIFTWSGELFQRLIFPDLCLVTNSLKKD